MASHEPQRRGGRRQRGGEGSICAHMSPKRERAQGFRNRRNRAFPAEPPPVCSTRRDAAASKRRSESKRKTSTTWAGLWTGRDPAPETSLWVRGPRSGRCSCATSAGPPSGPNDGSSLPDSAARGSHSGTSCAHDRATGRASGDWQGRSCLGPRALLCSARGYRLRRLGEAKRGLRPKPQARSTPSAVIWWCHDPDTGDRAAAAARLSNG